VADDFDPHFDGPDQSTTNLHRRAIRERWPMSPAIRVKVLNRVCKILDEDAAWPDGVAPPNHREVIAAARTLILADRLNLDQQRIDLAAGRGDDEAAEWIDAAAAARALDALNGPQDDRDHPGDPVDPAG
jgi:hypothetical protein